MKFITKPRFSDLSALFEVECGIVVRRLKRSKERAVPFKPEPVSWQLGFDAGRDLVRSTCPYPKGSMPAYSWSLGRLTGRGIRRDTFLASTKGLRHGNP